MPTTVPSRVRAFLRVALSYYVSSGLSAAFGLLLISSVVHAVLGPFAAASATVGVIVVTPPDQPAPQRGKFWHLVPAALIGVPLFFAVQEVHADALRLAVLLVAATFTAFLGAAWGKRGLPVSISVMFAMIFSMAVPLHAPGQTAVETSLYFALGAAAYLVYATLANSALNARYRVAVLADTLLSVASLMRLQAQQFDPDRGADALGGDPLVGRLLARQAALADQLQSARDMLLESPRTRRRQQLAGMLMQVLELRDHLVACELDLDALKSHPSQLALLQSLAVDLKARATAVEALADALLLTRRPLPPETGWSVTGTSDAAQGGRVAPDDPTAAGLDVLALGLVRRVGHIRDEVRRLTLLARGELEPDLDVVQATWQMFISPTQWSWRPFAGLWRWDAPPLRHAVRAAAAIGVGQAVSLVLPWGTHDYWILLTIVVVLRGSLAQTLERRNSRVVGTLLGCLLAGALLFARVPVAVLLATVTLAQGIAHGFAVKRYLVTAVAATVLALLQAHLLNAGVSPAFEAVERIADTFIGVAIAWGFSYVLPSWERNQIPALVTRTLVAQGRHAQVALKLGVLSGGDRDVEVGWRLARREVYDSLSALVQATQRSLAEPRAVRPPLEPLERLLAHSYQLLAQLTAVKTMLLLRRSRLDETKIRLPLLESAQTIAQTLSVQRATQPADALRSRAPQDPGELLAATEQDLSPWMLRRLRLAADLAMNVRIDAARVLQPVEASASSTGR